MSKRLPDNNYPNFITGTIVRWVPILDYPDIRSIILKALIFAIRKQRIYLTTYVIMPNHVHLIVAARTHTVNTFARDFKSWTNRKIIRTCKSSSIHKLHSTYLKLFWALGQENSLNTGYQVWQNRYHPIYLKSRSVYQQKVDYIHNNPVKAGLVDRPEDYEWSSACPFNPLKDFLSHY